ncbi:cytochrome P450 4V2-like isoform X2 [Apostichopus japonicus]|uniref:cytochrome P450 4V2-like isoform X2 n=1 Tax=Stichopus japonicus TaxID=307972 RepID=UPI003AB1D940
MEASFSLVTIQFVMYMGWTSMLIVYNERDLENVLRDTSVDLKAFQYYLLKDWLHDGLLMSKGPKWVSRRKLLTPSFHFSILEKFLPTMIEHAQRLSDRLCGLSDSPAMDIIPIITMTSLDTIFETIMGVDLRSQKGQGQEYMEAVHKLGTIFTQRTQCPWYWNDTFFRCTSVGREWMKALKTLQYTTKKVIADRKKELENMRSTDDVTIDDMSQEVRKRRKLAFLDLLIEAQRQNSDLTDEGIQEEVDTFMFEGHDTISSTVALAFYLLARNPEVQRKVHEELDLVLGNDRDKKIMMEDLQKLEYLGYVMKECQRVLTTVPYVGRNLESDKHMCGTILPKGTPVWMGYYWLHRDPKYFPNPEKFDPDRFLPANSQDRPNFTFLPFSAGHRNCIGQKFALMEQKAMMASVLRKVKMTSTQTFEELGLVNELILRASKGIHIKISLRD